MPTEEGNRILGQVELDVNERLGGYFPPDDDAKDDGSQGFSVVESFGGTGVVEGNADNTSAFTFVRWRWRGRHEQPIPWPVGDTTLVAPTGNPVLVEGLTAIESVGGEEFRARWFVDWLSVYAQLGVVAPGRPVKMQNVEVRSPFVDDGGS